MTFAVADTSFGDNEKKVEHGFDLESDTESNHHRKSVKILDYTNHCCGLEKDRSLVYTDIINFEKGSSPCSVPNQSRCVMCGVSDALIPTQNKNVCKSCDSVPWLVKCPAVVVKFCKGRHKFFMNQTCIKIIELFKRRLDCRNFDFYPPLSLSFTWSLCVCYQIFIASIILIKLLY